MALMINLDDFSDARARWLAGKCPCCGMEIEEWYDGTEPEALGEGVSICGRCVANQHMTDPDVLEAMLRSLLPGQEGG
jgi:hypothetical protein